MSLVSRHVSVRHTVPAPRKMINVLPLSSLLFCAGAMSFEQYDFQQPLSPASAGDTPPWSIAYTYFVLAPLP